MSRNFIGRQAIFGRDQRVHAYELLYRGDPLENFATFEDGDRATAIVVSQAFLESGIQRLTGDALCFINLTNSFILGRRPLPLPADRVVLEILEDVEPTPEIVQGVLRLKQQGALIALDDFVYQPGIEALIELSDYVKIDIQAQSREQVVELYDYLRTFDVKILAEKVQTEEDFRFCEELGFDFYQGFFLTMPEVIQGRRVSTSRFELVKMLHTLLGPNVGPEELSRIVSQDASLAEGLWRYCKSSLYAADEAIASIPHMVGLLGLETVRKIVSLLILVDLDDESGDLLEQALVRARMCELIAESCSPEEPLDFYTVGLLSTLDSMTGIDMQDILECLPQADEIGQALVTGEGELGEALECVRAFERGDWEHPLYLDLGEVELSEMHAKALSYSREIFSGVSTGIDAA